MIRPRRFARLKEILDQRQPDLAVVMDNVHKGHNFSAVLRTCDAVGVLRAHAYLAEGGRLRTRSMSAAGSGRWMEVEAHPSIEEAVAAARRLTAPAGESTDACQVLAAHLSPRAVDFRNVDFTRPTAILLGQELDGVSAEALKLCDGEVVIPMHGMAGSLNVSVAAALLLYEAQRQRQQAGLYEECRLDRPTYDRILFEWAYPRLAELCRSKDAPYPPLSEDGEILGPVPR